MNGADEDSSLLPAEGKARIAMAWLSWWFMLSAGGLAAFYLLVFLAFIATGGVEFLTDLLTGQEKYDPSYTKIILAALFVGAPPGALLGVRLWAKLMRRTGWISAERIKQMSGF